jgi:NAD(P)-dependent dehydrogenase (short-subunit alcohol dehydrogenase family)
MHVWMIDIDEKELILAVELVKAAAVVIDDINKESFPRIEYRVVDVSNYDAMTQLADQVFAADDQNCHILMNNAGIGQGGGAMTSLDVVHHVMNVNTYGPIHGCLAFVPKMKASHQPGIVINTGSKQGITMPPGNLTYNMSKAALKVYTEGLEHEFMLERRLRQQRNSSDNDGIRLRAALLIPGWVNTSIVLKSMRAKNDQDNDDDDYFNNVPFHEDKPASGAWMPQQVVDFMIQQLDMGRFYVVCPDNDVSRTTDDLRMTWTMQDITQNRQPLSRWHPDFQEEFNQYIQAATSGSSSCSSNMK